MPARGASGRPTARTRPLDCRAPSSSAALRDSSYGFPVSLEGDTLVVGAQYDDDHGLDSGAAYVFREIGGFWQQLAKLSAADGAAGDQFGVGVGISGGRVIAGAPGHDDAGAESGAAYVFQEIGGTWVQQPKLLAADGAAGDFFGVSVALNGAAALLGAFGDDDGGDTSGSAYVFAIDPACAADFDGDGVVGLADLSNLLDNFGCGTGDACYDAQVDLDGNGSVDLADLSELLSGFGLACP